MSHLGLVRAIALRFVDRGEPLEDLVQVGALALIGASDRFCADRRTKFANFAVPTIVGSLKRHFRDKTWVLKVPRRLKELYVEYHRVSRVLDVELGRMPTVAELAIQLNVSPAEVEQVQELSHAYSVMSLDLQVAAADDTGVATLSENVGESDRDLESVASKLRLRDAFATLDRRERAFVRLRLINDLTQKEIAALMQLSPMQVSRLSHRVAAKLQHLANYGGAA
ncbi:MAG: sigma-70 family RNA polymerase sigma factor [Candidatus Eremiobacteraeota bacterium]|nr:sigma-70 family RNA polymerase sigma factor [Candidatus Eremiobacteraeota bacterium]